MNYKIIKGFPNYNIYENGIVYNNKRKKNVSIAKDYRFKLNNKGVSKMFRITHVLYELYYNEIITEQDDVKFINDTIKNKLHYTNLIKTIRVHPRRNMAIFKFDKSKEWKIIKNYKNYMVSNYGDVYSVRLNKLLTSTLLDGYLRINLETNKKPLQYFIHTLVYDTFIGLTNKDLVIDHSDRNKRNNYIGNLQEVTRSQNAKNVNSKIFNKNEIYQYTKEGILIKIWNSYKEILKHNKRYNVKELRLCCMDKMKTAYGYIWEHSRILKDITMFYSLNTHDGNIFSNYKIDKYGNIINRHNKLLRPQLLNKYHAVHLTEDGGDRISYLIHRLTALTFIKNLKNHPVVNHKDKNKLNNNVDNLEWCTIKYNNQHGHGRKVNQIDLKTNKIIKTYNSVSEAYDFFGKKYSRSIARACDGTQKTAYKFKWQYVDVL